MSTVNFDNRAADLRGRLSSVPVPQIPLVFFFLSNLLASFNADEASIRSSDCGSTIPFFLQLRRFSGIFKKVLPTRRSAMKSGCTRLPPFSFVFVSFNSAGTLTQIVVE